MKLFVFILLLPLVQLFEVIDYSNEPYVPIPIEQAYYFKDNGTLFHIFNISELEERLYHYESMVYYHTEMTDKKLIMMVEQCKDYIEQLTVHRNKRSIDFLGKIIKFVAGNPDHDDLIMVQDKLNELVENNNQLSIINSKLKQNLDYLTGNSKSYNLEVLYEWLTKELAQIIHTINLAKSGILNTEILNLREINNIIKEEANFDVPLMEILEHATFKILQTGSIYVLLIKYPKIKEKCMLYSIRPVELEVGKLQLENDAMFCNSTYISVQQCKKYVNTNICRYQGHSCTEQLLNGFKANCTVIKEHMTQIDEVDSGKIIIHGTHLINNITKIGTYLILFNESICIDQQNYTNDKELVAQYLRGNIPSEYKILDIIESQNEELRIPTLSMIEKIPHEVETHPIRSAFVMIVIFIVLIVVLHFSINIYRMYAIYRLRKEKERANAYVRAMFYSKGIEDNPI